MPENVFKNNYLVKYHLATELVTTIDWHANINSLIHTKAII